MNNLSSNTKCSLFSIHEEHICTKSAWTKGSIKLVEQHTSIITGTNNIFYVSQQHQTCQEKPLPSVTVLTPVHTLQKKQQFNSVCDKGVSWCVVNNVIQFNGNDGVLLAIIIWKTWLVCIDSLLSIGTPPNSFSMRGKQTGRFTWQAGQEYPPAARVELSFYNSLFSTQDAGDTVGHWPPLMRD